MEPDAVDNAISEWRVERPDLDPTPIGVFGRVMRVEMVAGVRLRRLLSRFGLTPATFDVLAILRRAGIDRKVTPGELAGSSLLSTGATTFRLDRLEEQGLIERVPAEHDKRVVYISLTPEGRRLIDEVFAEHLAQEARMLRGLSDADIATLTELLRSLERTIANDSSSP